MKVISSFKSRMKSGIVTWCFVKINESNAPKQFINYQLRFLFMLKHEFNLLFHRFLPFFIILCSRVCKFYHPWLVNGYIKLKQLTFVIRTTATLSFYSLSLYTNRFIKKEILYIASPFIIKYDTILFQLLWPLTSLLLMS